MPTLHIEQPITDLDTQATTFNRFAKTRREAGVQAERVPRPDDSPSYVVIDLDLCRVLSGRGRGSGLLNQQVPV